MSPGTLVVVTGPPGAGKSAVSRLLAAGFEPSAVVRGDDFFEFLATGYVEPWLPASHEQNHVVIAAAAAATSRFVDGGYTVVYDGVIGAWFLPEFAAACAVSTLHYVVLMPPEEVAVDRVRTRTGHGFTDLAAARQMYAEFHDGQSTPGMCSVSAMRTHQPSLTPYDGSWTRAASSGRDHSGAGLASISLIATCRSRVTM